MNDLGMRGATIERFTIGGIPIKSFLRLKSVLERERECEICEDYKECALS